MAGAASAGVALGGGLTAVGSESAEAAPTVLDDFEDGDLSEYAGTTAEFSVEQSSAMEGSYRLKAIDSYGKIAHSTTSPRGYEYKCRLQAGSGSSSKPGLLVSAQDRSRPLDDCYWLSLNVPGDEIALIRRDSASNTRLGSANVSLSEGTEYRGVIELGEDTVKAVLYDANGSQLAETATISDTTFTGGYFGFYNGGSPGYPCYFDYVTRSPLPSNEGSALVIDDFEDGDLAEYTFDRGAAGASVVSSPTYSGSYALQISNDNTEMISTDGLWNYPSAGDTFRTQVRGTNGATDIDVTYGVQDHDNRYYVNVEIQYGAIRLAKLEGGNSTILDADSTFGLSEDTWYELVVEWTRDGTHTVRIYDPDGTKLGQCSATDSTWSSGGFGYDGFLASSGGTAYFDVPRITICDDSGMGVMVEDFEDGDLSKYSFDQGASGASIISRPEPVNTGSKSLRISASDTEMIRTSDLPAEPNAGDQFCFHILAQNGADDINLTYGAQNHENRYFVQISFDSDELGLYRCENGTTYKLARKQLDFTLKQDVWYRVEVDWWKSGYHIINIQNGAQYGEVSARDTTWAGGGFGYDAYLTSSGGNIYIDTIAKEYYESTDTGCLADDFEDGDLSEYRFDTGSSYASVVSSPTFFGNHSLEIRSGTCEMISLPGDGLESYPGAGDRFRYRVNANNLASPVNLAYGVQNHENRYFVRIDFSNNELGLYRYEDGSSTNLDQQHHGFILDNWEWYRVEVNWRSDGNHQAVLLNESEDVLAKVSAKDSTWANGGIGYDAYLDSSEAVYIDHVLVDGAEKYLRELEGTHGQIQNVDIVSLDSSVPLWRRKYTFKDGTEHTIDDKRRNGRKTKKVGDNTYWHYIPEEPRNKHRIKSNEDMKVNRGD